MEKEKPTYKIERRKNKNQNLYNRQRELRKQVPDFDLKIEIPNNLKIKDQKNLN